LGYYTTWQVFYILLLKVQLRNKMQLILSDKSSFDIDIKQNRVWDKLKHGYKHLQHVPIQFYPWDNKLKFNRSNVKQLVDTIVKSAEQLNVIIDPLLCEQCDQPYLNYLHEVYERNYNGDKTWLILHDHIHLLENALSSNSSNTSLSIDWRDLAGPLKKDFKHNMLEQGTTRIYKGDVYVRWQELGKVPYNYWKDKEPNNINRIKELCKPWLILRHTFCVALHDVDFTVESDSFNIWWDQYHNDFCMHYNIPNWDLKQMHSVIVLGNLQDIDSLNVKLSQDIVPDRIKI